MPSHRIEGSTCGERACGEQNGYRGPATGNKEAALPAANVGEIQTSSNKIDSSPLIMVDEDSSKRSELCILPPAGVQVQSKMDLLLASTLSDDEDTPDECERGALNRCIQQLWNCKRKLKVEKMKYKVLERHLVECQDEEQKKDAELRSISTSLQRQQAIFAQQCKTVQLLRKELDKKDTAILGMQFEQVWRSNILASSEQHANALQEISDRLASIETPQKQTRVTSPAQRVQPTGTGASPLSNAYGFLSPSSCPTGKNDDKSALAATHADIGNNKDVLGLSTQLGGRSSARDDSFCSDGGDENACVNTPVRAVNRRGSTPGRQALGVLHDVENTLGRGSDDMGTQRGESVTHSAASAAEDTDKQQQNTSSEHSYKLNDLQAELDDSNARNEVMREELGQARALYEELQAQCKKLNTELEATRHSKSEDLRRLQAEVNRLSYKLDQKEQLADKEYMKQEKAFYLDGLCLSDSPASQQSCLSSPGAASPDAARRVKSPEALTGGSHGRLGLWNSALGTHEHQQQRMSERAPSAHSSPAPAGCVLQDVSTTKPKSGRLPSSPGLARIEPQLKTLGSAQGGVQAATVSRSRACSAEELHSDAVVMQEALQGRLRAASVEPRALDAATDEDHRLRAVVQRIQEHLSCGTLDELEPTIKRLAASGVSAAAHTEAPDTTVLNATEPHVVQPAHRTLDEQQTQTVADRTATQQDVQQLELKNVLQSEREGWASEREKHAQVMQELRDQLQQTEQRLQGLAEVQEMTVAELAEARAERDSAVAATSQSASPQARPVMVDQAVCTDADAFSHVHELDPTTTAHGQQASSTVSTALQVAELPTVPPLPHYSPSKRPLCRDSSCQTVASSDAILRSEPQVSTSPQPTVPGSSTKQPGDVAHCNTAVQTVQEVRDKLEDALKERDSAVARVTELESSVRELQQSCAALKQRAADSEQALRVGWPAVKQEVEELTEKCRKAESEVTLYKTLNSQLQSHLDNLRHQGTHLHSSTSSADAALSEQRPHHKEPAVTRSDEPRSDTLLQLVHSASEGQAAARAAADAAESELRDVRGALREAETQVAATSKCADDLALQLKEERLKSKELREQSRRMVRQVQGQLHQPFSSRRISTSHHSEAPSLGASPRHASFMAPPTPADGTHTLRCNTNTNTSSSSIDGNAGTHGCVHDPCRPGRCESAPPVQQPNSACNHTSSFPYSQTYSQSYDSNTSTDPVTCVHLTVNVPRGRLATVHSRSDADPSRRSTSLPPSRAGTQHGDSSPLCHAISALQGEEPGAAAENAEVQVNGDMNCSGCQALQFHLGRLEEQLASAEHHASAATAAQVDLAERESALVEELQMALSVRDSLQAQLGGMATDLHTASQQRDLAFEQLSQFVAVPGVPGAPGPVQDGRDGALVPASVAAGSVASDYHSGLQNRSARNASSHATSHSKDRAATEHKATTRALQELQTASAKAHKDKEQLQRELEACEATVASLRADVARADSTAAEAAVERKQATENAVRAECSLAAAEVRLASLQQQLKEVEHLKSRFADSEYRVRNLETQLDAVKRELKETKAERDSAVAHSSELSGRMKEISNREEEARTVRETISTDLASLRAQLAESSAEASRVWDECSELRLRLSKAEDSVHAEQEKALGSSRMVSRLQGELSDARRDTETAREGTVDAERRARAAEARLRDAEDAAAAARQEADASRSRSAQYLQDSESLARKAHENSSSALQAAEQRADETAKQLQVATASIQALQTQRDALQEQLSTAEASESAAKQSASTAVGTHKSEVTALKQQISEAESAKSKAEQDARTARDNSQQAQEALQAAMLAKESAEQQVARERQTAASAVRDSEGAKELAETAEAKARDLREQLAAAEAQSCSTASAARDEIAKSCAEAVAGVVAAAATAAAAKEFKEGISKDYVAAASAVAAPMAPCTGCATLQSSLQERESEILRLRQTTSNAEDTAAARSTEVLQLRKQLATAECDMLALKADVRKAQEDVSNAQKESQDSADAAAKAGRDAQAAAKQAADAQAEVSAARDEAALQRSAAEAAAGREQQLQTSVKSLSADVEKWKAAAEQSQARARNSSVAAGSADSDAREAKDALKALQADLASLRRRERSARVEVAQLRGKLTALDDFAGDQFEASLCATPSCHTLGMSVHGEESSVAGDMGACTDVESVSVRGEPHSNPAARSIVPYRSVPLEKRRPAAFNGDVLIPSQPPEDAHPDHQALVAGSETALVQRKRTKGHDERLYGAVSRQVLQCLHRALCGLCAAMPEVYAASVYWSGLGSRGTRHADEQAQLQHIIGAAGDLLQTPHTEHIIAGMSSNNQVCLKAVVAICKLRSHSQSLAARLQSADLRAAQMLNFNGLATDTGAASDAAPHRPGSSCSNVLASSGMGASASTPAAKRFGQHTGLTNRGTFTGHTWEGKGSCSPRRWGKKQAIQARAAPGQERQHWQGDLAWQALQGVPGHEVDIDDTVSDFLGSIASQAAL